MIKTKTLSILFVISTCCVFNSWAMENDENNDNKAITGIIKHTNYLHDRIEKLEEHIKNTNRFIQFVIEKATLPTLNLLRAVSKGDRENIEKFKKSALEDVKFYDLVIKSSGQVRTNTPYYTQTLLDLVGDNMEKIGEDHIYGHFKIIKNSEEDVNNAVKFITSSQKKKKKKSSIENNNTDNNYFETTPIKGKSLPSKKEEKEDILNEDKIISENEDIKVVIQENAKEFGIPINPKQENKEITKENK